MDNSLEEIATELERFEQLQRRLAPMFEEIMPDPFIPRTVVVIPSLTLDERELAKIDGVNHYEERMLCMLLLLRLPRTQVIYVTSTPLNPDIVDYYLHLLSGIPGGHARRRLEVMSCHDGSIRPLSQKILDRPRMLRRLRRAIRYPETAHMVCFNATPIERKLAVALDIPLYGNDPALAHLGSKTGSREIFRAAGVPLPPGFERLRSAEDIAGALAALRTRDPSLERAVVKLDEGFSGEGNALFSYSGAPEGASEEELAAWILDVLPRRLAYEAAIETWDSFNAKFEWMGGIVEAFVSGEGKRSPSVQCRITPTGEVDIVSTHDQILGGPTGQIFLGATFPAHRDYRLELQRFGTRVGRTLADRGVLGRFAVDFVSVPDGQGGWQHYAIEINIRKGGTTHPFLMLQLLTDGAYDLETGTFRTRDGRERVYFATDNLHEERYIGLTPEDLVDIIVCEDLHYHTATAEGVTFHLIGALSEFGKLGMVCISDTHEHARALYDRTVAVLDREAERARRGM